MRRFWLENSNWVNERQTLSGDLFHHLRDVCRFGVDDKFELLHGGEAYFVRVVQVDKRQMEVERLETRPIPALPRPHIHLALSLPKFPKVDWIVEKSVELGVKAIHPFVSDFSFTREVRQVPEAKMERWRKLIRQAAQQSGRGELMSMEEVCTLEQILAQINQKKDVLGLFPYEGECPTTLKAHLRALPHRDFSEIWLVVGSEGGFSHNEVKVIAQAGLTPVTLGAQVLRVETACVALASILKYEFEAQE